MAEGNFETCVAITLRYEGGFSDNPADPGGATNFGITLRTLAAFLGRAATIDDVRNMPSSTALAIYQRNYWNALRCDAMPIGVDMMVFDFEVNSGRHAAEALQAIVGTQQDGVVGPATLTALAGAVPVRVISTLGRARMTFLRSLDAFADFGDGWTNRVTDVTNRSLAMAGASVIQAAAPTADQLDAEYNPGVST